ncbi:MAG: GNAT family N-acetyltransferase [bacterium]
MNIAIDIFRPRHASRFAELNREWLERYNLMESSEEEQLADPQAHFLDCGGQIFVALHDDNVIGTCAVVPHGVDEFELAKLAVSSEFRGQGIARRLVERCIAYVREQGVRRVILVSNSQLKAALRLYESLGFKYCALPEVRKYEVADVYMVLDLDIAEPAK